MRVTDNHLMTIFSTIERDCEGDLKKIIAYLDGTVAGEDQITLILNRERLVTQFFANTRDFPRDEIAFKTADFVAKLSLLTLGSKLLSQNSDESLRQKYQQHLQYLMSSSEEIFKNNNIDAQIYLLLKLRDLNGIDTIKNTKGLCATLYNYKLTELVKKILIALPNNEMTPRFISSLINFVYLVSKNSEIFLTGHYSEWRRDFVVTSLGCLLKQTNYTSRNIALMAIFKSWELIKDDVKDGDLKLLQGYLKNLWSDYKKFPSRITLLHNKINQFFQNSGITWSMVLMCSPFIIVPWALVIFALLMERSGIEILQEYERLLTQATPQEKTELLKLEPQMQVIRTSIQARNTPCSDLNEQMTSANRLLYILFFMIAGTVITFVAYKAVGFFKRPAEEQPVALPEWMRERLQNMNSQAENVQGFSPD